jgi:hypothetical protein
MSSAADRGLIRRGDAQVFFAPLVAFSHHAGSRAARAEGQDVPPEDLRPPDPQLLIAAFDLALKRLRPLSRDGAYLALSEWRSPFDLLRKYFGYAEEAMLDSPPAVNEALAERVSQVSRELGRLGVIGTAP